MATWVGVQRDLHSLLGALIELDYYTMAAYRSATPQLSCGEYRHHFGEFQDDYGRHIRELCAVYCRLGGVAPSGASAPCCAEENISLANLTGGDRAIFLAMRRAEADCNMAYQRVVRRRDIPGCIALIAERSLADERMHCAWFDQHLILLGEQDVGAVA